MLINTISDYLAQRIENNELSNQDIVQLIEMLGTYCNLKTIPDYAKENNMSYNGVKNNREIINIFNTKFVIYNQ